MHEESCHSSGPKDAKVAIVSRSPGYHDVKADKPFSGPTGKIVDYLLSENGVKRSDTFTTNVVMCQTDKPPQAAIDACAPRLMHELFQLTQLETVILAGSEPVKSTLQMGLKEARGRRFTRSLGARNITAVATYNPAVVMRDDAVFPDLRADFRRALTKATPFKAPQQVHVYTLDHAEEVLRMLLYAPRLAIDIESTGLRTHAKLVSIGFSFKPTVGYVFSKEICRSDAGLALLRAFFDGYRGRQSWHNGKFDTKILKEHGCNAKVDDDTLLMSYALDERTGGVHGLDYLLQNELDWPYYETEEVTLAKKNGFKEDPDISIGIVGFTKTERLRVTAGKKPRNVRVKVKCSYPGISDWAGVYNYNGLDAVGSYCLVEKLEPRVKADNVEKPYQFMCRASNALVEVERRGIYIDKHEANRLVVEEVKPRLSELQFRGEAITGRSINFNSPKQTAEVLYDSYGLVEPTFRPGKERSTDSINRDEWLRTITNPGARDFIELLDEYKKLDKLRGTYLEGLVNRIDPDGRLRCEILLHGTETGRTSSRGPNLQNIPRVDPNSKYQVPNVKSIFRASPGNIILQADFSQAELRCAAVISGDPGLLRVYAEGRDLHSEVAEENYGHDFTKEQRFYAKTVNFGILYGMGDYALSRELTRRTGKEVSVATAGRLISNWWRQFPVVKTWVNNVHRQVRKEGELVSAFGRKRRFHLITNDNLDHTLKEAVNFMMQSPASDLCVAALCDMVERYRAPIWLAVHDSILLEVPEVQADLWTKRVTETMAEQADKLLGWTQIPFLADAQAGYDWGHLEDVSVAA